MRNIVSRKNNKGFSMVLVLVAMSIVALLVSAIFYAVYQNYLMKINHLKSEDSFYSTEQILDEIKAGLQSDMSASVTEAYNYVLERYSETEGQDATRDWYFQTKFVDALRAQVLDSSNVTLGIYDIEKIANYVVGADQSVPMIVNKDFTENVAEASFVMKDGGAAKISIDAAILANSLSINYSSGVTLKNLKVELTDANGYYSVISTDVCLGIPVISFTQTSTAPDILSYGIIANKGIKTQGTSGNIIKGNMFAGTDGMQISSGSKMEITSEDYAISEGLISVAFGAELVFQGGSMWTKGVTLDSSTLRTNGNAYVRDDLTLNGKSSLAQLKGNYYGFSNPDRLSINVTKDEQNVTADSSAIIVNGRASVLDVSELNSLMLAGNTFVKANVETNAEGSSKSPVLMGESIAVKSNQLMYLVPPQILNIENTTGYIPGNPIEGLTAGAVVTMRTDESVAELGGMTLAQLGIGANDCQVYYTQDGSAYVYMDLNEKQAAAYAKAYYSSDAGLQMKEYLQLFLNDITLAEDARVQTNGNILTHTKIYANTIDETSNLAEVAMEETSYQESYLALTKILLADYRELSEDEKESDVFNNLVYTSHRTDDQVRTWTFDNFLTSYGTGGSYTFKTSQDKVAVLSSGDYEVDNDDSNVHLLVVDGDVTVKANTIFEGVIICSGTVTLGEGAKVNANPAEAAAVFQCITPASGDPILDGEVTISPMYFFREGEDYLLSSIATGVVHGSAGTLIDVADYITYNNWKKM